MPVAGDFSPRLRNEQRRVRRVATLGFGRRFTFAQVRKIGAGCTARFGRRMMIANAWIERVNTAPSRTGLVPSPPAVRSATQSIASGERDRVRGSQSQAVIPHPIPLPWRRRSRNLLPMARERGPNRSVIVFCVGKSRMPIAWHSAASPSAPNSTTRPRSLPNMVSPRFAACCSTATSFCTSLEPDVS